MPKLDRLDKLWICGAGEESESTHVATIGDLENSGGYYETEADGSQEFRFTVGTAADPDTLSVTAATEAASTDFWPSYDSATDELVITYAIAPGDVGDPLGWFFSVNENVTHVDPSDHTHAGDDLEPATSRTATEPANVRAHGAEGDGTTDDTAAVKAAIEAATGAVYFPPDEYFVTDPLDLLLGMEYLGDGPENSAIHFDGVTGFQTSGRVDDWAIHGLHIEDVGGGSENVGIDAQGYSSYYDVTNSRVEGFGSYGIHHSGLDWKLSDVRFQNNGEATTGESASVRLANRAQVPTTGEYERVYLKSGGLHGFLLTNSRQIFLENCICEYHDVAFRAVDCNSVFVEGFWPEENTAADPVQTHDSNVQWKSDVGPTPVRTWENVAWSRRYATEQDRLDIRQRDVIAERDVIAPENPSITPVVDSHTDTAAPQGVDHTFTDLPTDASKSILEGTYSRTASGYGELNIQINGVTTADYDVIDKDGSSQTRDRWPVVRVRQETSGVPFRVELGTDDGTINVDSGGADPQAAVSGYVPGVAGLDSITIYLEGDTYSDGTVDCTLLKTEQ